MLEYFRNKAFFLKGEKMEIGKIFLKYRKKLGYSLVQMGKKIGYSKSQISYVEKTNKASVKIIENFLQAFLDIEDKEKFFLKKVITKKIGKKEKVKITKEKQYTTHQLQKYEQEILETYDMMRMDINPYTKIAMIKRALIEINKTIEENILILEIALEPSDIKILKRIERPLKTTLKNMEKNTEKIKKILAKEIIVIEEE